MYLGRGFWNFRQVLAERDGFNDRSMNQIKASQEDVTSVRNMMIFFVLTPFFSTFAAVMCDFLNRDVRFLGVSLADRLDSVVQKFSRIVYFGIQYIECQRIVVAH